VTTPRRSPKFGAFILTGAVIGFIIGSAIAYFGPATPSYTTSSGVGFIGLLIAAVGALAGALLAIALDRRG
jgi:hypothetical protein